MPFFEGKTIAYSVRSFLFVGCSALVGTFPFVLVAYTADGEKSAEWRPYSTVGRLRTGRSDSLRVRVGNIRGGDDPEERFLPRRLHEAFDSYSARLRADIQLIVEAPLEHLKSRFAATGVSTIGWLQKETSQPVVDGTEQFMVIIDSLHERHQREHSYLLSFHGLPEKKSPYLLRGSHNRTHASEAVVPSEEKTTEADARLSDFAYILVPGLLSQYSPPLYFMEALNRFRDELKLETHFVHVDSEASCTENAATIKEVIVRCYTETGKRVVLIGHSKGGLDAAAAVAMFPELAQMVEGVVFVQSPYGGSPVASDMLQDTALRDAVHFVLMTILHTRQDALDDLTYKARRAFLHTYPLPQNVASVSFHSNSMSPMSPFFLLAKYIQMRYHEQSDGVVACADAEVPGSVVVRFNATQMDHLGPIYPSITPLISERPSGADICEALVRLLLTRKK